MKKLLRPLPRKPEQWGEDAAKEHGWWHAYKIAKECGRDFIGKSADVPNPHRKYWQAVLKWIETNAPPDQLKEPKDSLN